MVSYVLDLHEIDRTQVAVAGGKGANLGELTRLDGVRVPAGFCVTTAACRRIFEAAGIDEQVAGLADLPTEDRQVIRTASEAIRRRIEDVAVPDAVAADIRRALAELGEDAAWAVRSSATAEDLPGASFAGQQDTYLNVVGSAAILKHVSRCCASLFTERAVAYRLHNGFGHDEVQLAVVVQRMVFPKSAGVLFTADPVTGNRRVSSVEAVFGLGEALVSGSVNPDSFKVRDGAIVAKAIATKRSVTRAESVGGTQESPVEPAQQDQPALTEEQVLRLVDLGRHIEAHFGCPQDIEWCLVDDGFHVVQSRPITTLFPVPENPDGANRVYVSVGHQQMMTDAMKPLGLSFWQLTSPAPMRHAGGRLFVDVTESLSSPVSREALIDALGRSDPLIGDALEAVIERGDFVSSRPGEPAAVPAPVAAAAPPPINPDPAIVAELIEEAAASVAAAERVLSSATGSTLIELIRTDIEEMRRVLTDPRSRQVYMAAIDATWWLDEQLMEWLGEKNVTDTLTLSAPGNITSEMGLALLDVADAVRPHPEVVALLQAAEGDDFLGELPGVEGGREALEAIQAYLDEYGVRCVGEIDITRPRWSERPSALVPMILADVKSFAAGESTRRFEHGRQEALAKEADLLERLRALPDGESMADETKLMIDRLRTFIGYREHPKYAMVSRYFVYKQALLGEAERLVRADVVDEPEDIYFLTFDELQEVVRTGRADRALIRERKDAFASYGALAAPRVLTSEGEGLGGSYRRGDVPDGALAGLAVSSGTVEGRARVIRDLAEADLEPGDILVTAYTDPSWSPLFVAASGLVTEVGGTMTHGAVVAREYGLPAVVGVEHATRLIADGQRIRVNGTDGYVEILRG